MWKLHQKSMIWLNGLLFNILGITWLYTFAATDFRTHYATFMIPAGILVLLFALGLYLLWTPCVALLLAVATGATIFCIHTQIATREFNPLLSGSAFLALLVVISLAPPLVRKFLDNEGNGNLPVR